MAFITLHKIMDNKEVVVNTDNIACFDDDYIWFNDGDDSGIRVCETTKEIMEIIEEATRSGK